MKNDSLKHLVALIRGDLPAYALPFWRAYLTVPGFHYTCNHRFCYYLYQKRWLRPLFVLQWWRMKHLTYKYGIQTSWMMDLPEHFTIAHFGGITFFPKSCGKNLYLRQGVTVGNNRRRGGGHPEIGDNVTFGANVVVAGPIKIGNNVVIGAGAVVVKDVPDNCVVAGVPAKVIKQITPPIS